MTNNLPFRPSHIELRASIGPESEALALAADLASSFFFPENFGFRATHHQSVSSYPSYQFGNSLILVTTDKLKK